MQTRRFLPVLLLLFIGSGCAALIYEVVWYQLLQLVIGSSAVSLAVLLGTFMGGLCLGSLGYARVASARRHPLKMYALLEAGIGVIGLLELLIVPVVGSAYSSWAGSGTLGIVLRAVAAGVCLLPPTLLMGATLPALARWIELTPRGVSWLGFFYAGNTAGAVLGAILAGFYLLRVYDMPTATFVAVALNAGVALLAFLLARATGHTAGLIAEAEGASTGKSRPKEPAATPAGVPGVRDIYIAIALSGMTALGSEVIWARLLSLTFGGTTYTFSLILGTFLLGLGIGSSVGAAVSRTTSSARLAFGVCQALLGACIAWAGYMLTQSLPFWPIDPSISSDPSFTFQLDIARSLWVVLPGAILWGASFPLALAASVAPGRDPARVVGGLFAANTAGAIIGSLGAGALVAWLGSQHAQQVLMILCALSALLVLQPVGDRAVAKGAHLRYAGVAIAIVVAGFLFARALGPIPGVLVGYGRFAATRVGQADFIYVGEGLNSSVAVSQLSNGVRNYHNAGKVQASSEPQDMRLQRMLGHLTTLLPDNPKSVVVIGCGAGVTAGAVSVDPRVEQLTIAEIEPLVVRTVSTYFAEHNFDVVRNPKTRIRIDDARHYLLTTDEQFDAITSDPLDPWVKGAAMLYSKEFFELVKRRLKPGGAVTLFVQLYESSEAAVKSEIATFFDVFPNGAVFANTFEGAGYDLVLVAKNEPLRINLDAWEERLRQPEYAPVRLSLAQIGFSNAIQLLSTFAGQARDLKGWLQDAELTRDSNLRLQYLAGLGLNLRHGDYIYRNMVAYRQSPDDMFTGSQELKTALWEFMRYQ